MSSLVRFATPDASIFELHALTRASAERHTGDMPSSYPHASPGGNVGRHPRRDAGDAFLPDPQGGESRATDDLAEIVAEAYLESATSGEERGEDLLNDLVAEELGGPFLEESLLDGAEYDVPLQARPPRVRRD